MFKNTITTSLKEVIKNRYLTVLCIAIALLSVAFLIYILITVRPSELQLVTHYTAYGVTHLYRDQWFYLLSFGGFGILAAILHIAMAIKAYMVKGQSLALLFAWMGIGVILFAWVTAVAIINVWSPV